MRSSESDPSQNLSNPVKKGAGCVAGLFNWRDLPLSGSWTIGVLCGINLIFDNLAMIFTGAPVR